MRSKSFIGWKNEISVPIILVSGYAEDYIEVTKSLVTHKNAKVIGSVKAAFFA